MTRQGLSQRPMDNTLFRTILLPVYYRHEFARRNKAVVNESREVLARFPLSSAMFSGGIGFIDAGDKESVTLADSLISEFMQEPSKAKKKAMREAFGRFVRERQVLPVPPPPGRFFPKEMGCLVLSASDSAVKHRAGKREKELTLQLFEIWRSLVGFERFLLAEGMTDEPCFMPVMPLNQFHGTKGVHDLNPERLGKVSEHRLLVALDSTQSRECLSSNLEMLLIQLDILGRLRQETDTESRGSERMPWQTFDLYLQAYDFHKNADTAKSDKELAGEFYVKTNRATDTQVKVESEVVNFRRWLKEADTWVKDYAKIK